MNNLKKSRLYRVGSALMAAAMVLTCVPQTGLYAYAEEPQISAELPDSQEDVEVSAPETEAGDSGSQTGGSAVQPDDSDGQKKEEEKPADQNQDDSGDSGENADGNGDSGENTGGGSQPGDVQDEEQTFPEQEDGSAPMPAADPAVDEKIFSIDFSSIKLGDKTYDGKPVAIVGLPEGDDREETFTCRYQITGETRTGTAFDSGEKTFKIKGRAVTADTQAAYDQLLASAPAETGSYKLHMTAEHDRYEGEPQEISFSITPLLREESRLIGVSGMKDRVYDGNPAELAQQIANARIQTDKDVDITGKVKVSFRIKGTTEGGAAYDETIEKSSPADGMPVDAGKYTLLVNLEENGSQNYQANDWAFSFAITKREVKITANNQEMHVSADAGLPAGSPLPDSVDNQYLIEGILDADRAAFEEKLQIVVGQDVDFSKTGIYDLAAAGIVEADWPNYMFSDTAGKLTVKAKLKAVDEKLKAVTNIPNGLTLAQIAEQYLSRKTTQIYLQNGLESENKPDIIQKAAIVWNTEKVASGSYSDKEKRDQKFEMQGTVVLPELVYADAGTPVTVRISISVREAYDGQALRPRADTPSGTVNALTKVRLISDEEGARIYYTVDASDPRVSVTRREYNEPIEIKSTMTIRAISYIYGKRDSEELRVTYYMNPSQKPGGPDDPDDNEDVVPPEDIPKDENGKPTEIPKDLWVTDVPEYTYTGKAIKPEVRVYDYKKRLEEKKDYTISYKNNVNAADKKSVKAPVITITGRGNYEGKINKTFTIAPKDIRDADVKADDIAVAFNNRMQKPVPSITWSGKKLSANRDYRFVAESHQEAGSYPITLNGTGNYTGERKINFIISDGVPVPKLTVSRIAAYTYTGKAIEPEPTVKNGREVLEEGKDYTITYEDNVSVGTASVIIQGAKNSKYAGVKRVTFQIKEVAVMSRAKVEMQFGSGAVYTGSAVEPSSCVLTVKLNTGDVTLVKDKDYTVKYQNNVKAGNATAVFEGIGAYKGTLKKTYKINAYDLLADPNKKLEIEQQETYPYMKGGSTPKPVVRFNGKRLTEGTDYTLSYKNNKAAGSAATITVKGKGNFKGSASVYFKVGTQSLSELEVKPADKVYQAKANIYKTKVQVLDTNGKALGAGSDYDKNVIYTYAQRVEVDTASAGKVIRKEGDAVDAADTIPAGTQIRVAVKAAGSNYQGEASGIYRIVRSDIARARVTIPTQTYTGKAITLSPEKDISVLINGMVVSPEEFEIVGYTNNINKGTAKVTIRGTGNYGGTKTVTFKIKSKGLFSQMFG